LGKFAGRQLQSQLAITLMIIRRHGNAQDRDYRAHHHQFYQRKSRGFKTAFAQPNSFLENPVCIYVKMSKKYTNLKYDPKKRSQLSFPPPEKARTVPGKTSFSFPAPLALIPV